MVRKSWYAILTLLLLSPFTAEVLTGATTFPQFINPIGLGILVGLYGLGALLIRETRIRLSVGYGGVLLLGFAYGVIEEGIAVKSFFDPYWKDLGIFGVYGRWLGVNWVWSLYLTIFHSVWSILAPIILVEALYPDILDKPWIGKKGLAISLTLFSIDVILINLLLTKYRPSPIYYLGCLMIIAVLVYMAMGSKEHIAKPDVGPKRYGLYWALWGSCFFVFFYVISALIPLPLIPLTLGVLVGYIAYVLARQMDAFKQSLLHRYWLYTGIVVVLLFIDILQSLQLNIERLVTTILAVIVLTIMYRRVRRCIT